MSYYNSNCYGGLGYGLGGFGGLGSGYGSGYGLGGYGGYGYGYFHPSFYGRHWSIGFF
ncbi:keratin-associated protein 19-9b-like [Tupaia chinensis]|uniref:keratin-associated protein 19-9b-like n=1 Tax=Tupaia chinensis TaxID=246437 RepID=UPI000FFBF653|nr:keratin-associated protein 19-9b-like [Tupaia chinensis]XP_027630303.1 keratin-associated protein 19-9b-like [Tupaia chinensis]